MEKILIAVQSIDGFIAKHANDPLDWVSQEDRTYFRKATTEAGAIIFGRTTFESIGKALPNRLNIIMTSDPTKYTDITNELEFTNQTPQQIIDSLEKRGFNRVFIGGGNKVFSQFLNQNLVDEIWLSIEPIIFGKGVKPFSDITERSYNHLSTDKLNDNALLIKYSVSKS